MSTSLRYLHIYIFLFCSIPFIGHAQRNTPSVEVLKARWVDSVYQALNDTERVGQLFMIAAYSGGKDYNEDTVTKLVSRGQVGGLIFMQGTAEAQATQNNKYQGLAKVPLLIGMDAEWGLGMRLTGVKDLPRAMMTGATMDTNLAYRVGAAIAEQCNRMGVHINFGPVVDVNNNPKNPIINARSYGENKEWVAKMGVAYMRGMQDKGVMACAKHFPGHGDTDADSHNELPRINKTLQQLEMLELYPFRILIQNGVKSVMVAHLDVPALEKEPRIPTTLSNSTIEGQLRNKMGFDGLVFTDALNMQGVAKYYAAGEVDMKAFMAGNDVLLFSQNVPVAIDKILTAINEDRIPHRELEIRVKKILAAKYDAGLARRKDVNPANATADLNRYTEQVNYQMAEASATFVRDRNQLVDRLIRHSGSVGYIGINAKDTSTLLNELRTQEKNIDAAWLPKGSSAGASAAAMKLVNEKDVCIVAVHSMAFYPGSGNKYGLDVQQMSFLEKMQSKSNVVLVLMGNPNLLQHFCKFQTIFVGYEDTYPSEKIMANVVMGISPAMGQLPVTPCEGMTTERRTPLMADVPKTPKDPVVKKLEKEFYIEDAGVVNRAALDKLNLFLERSVVDGVFPGCQVLAAKNGRVFYNRAFGYYDHYKKSRVDTGSVYDVASLTKVLSTTLAVMRLYENKKLDPDKTLGYYLPQTQNTDKANIVIRDLLLHQAGLKSWIPFYKNTLDSMGRPIEDIYHTTADKQYSIPVAANMYMRNDYRDTIWNTILSTPPENKGRYVYSDLDFYFLAAVVEKITGKPLDEYVTEEFYKPMGLKTIGYHPLKRFPASRIVPTEEDNYFRMQTVHGYVHDQGAAMMGGIGGHAGIFSNAEDVAAIFQMLLQGGTYNGKKFFKKETIGYFIAYRSALSRRGLGFDKPEADAYNAGPTGDRVSGYAFGHQGFTGTCAWADPESGVVFVFLSNRVNPNAENKKINSQSTRTLAQDYIYEALGLPVNKNRPAVKREQMAKQR